METNEKRSGLLRVGAVIAIITLVVIAAFAQWGPQNTFWQMGSGGWQLNCPPNACSIQGSVVNLPGASAISQLASNSAGSSTNSLVNSGISFPIAASETGSLNCEIYFTNGSGGGLELSINGPGTAPAQLEAYSSIGTAASTSTFTNYNGGSSAAWQPTLGSTTSTVTTMQHAHIDAAVVNGTTAGTLAIQYADVNTTGTTILLQGSWCRFP